MHDGPAILGFRQDRVGARLICLLNVLRLGALFGVDARYAWLSQPDGPYPDLADPAEILDPAFVARHLVVVDCNPDLAGREALHAAAPASGVAQFAGRLARGRRWYCDSAFEMTAFRDEPVPEVAAQTARLVAELPLSRKLARARERALERLARVGGGEPVAIHVRRGDILDGDPWSYAAWPSKYVPDEFFRAFIDDADGPVVAFSDTPQAVLHLAQGNPRIVPVGDLVDDTDLSTAQRDVLELLLMAGCRKVGAPAFSAFSRAAQVIGQAQVASLPAALPNDRRVAAYDALLDRAITAPDSFFAAGDLAQSLVHATGHAAGTGRGRELLAAVEGRDDLLDRFPFVGGEVALLALKSGMPGAAVEFSRRMDANPRLRQRDRIAAAQIRLTARLLEAENDPAPDPAAEGEYLSDLFIGRRAQGLLMSRLGGLVLRGRGPAAQALMLPPGLLRDLTASASTDAGVPPWIAQLGWVELIQLPEALAQLRKVPPAWRKLEPVEGLLKPAEAALAEGGTPPDASAGEQAALGFAASALTLDNRLMRAMRLLEWLNGQRPDEPMTHKRMADACFAAGNERAGRRWLDSALERAPGNALFALSAAVRLGRADPRRAADLLEQARKAWPGLALTRSVAQRVQSRAEPRRAAG